MNQAERGYRAPQVCRMVGITYRQLDYWARTGFMVPSLQQARGSGSQRLYSFADLVQLKVIKKLLDAGMDLRRIRSAFAALSNQRSTWSWEDGEVTLASDGASIYALRSPEEVIDLLRRARGCSGWPWVRWWKRLPERSTNCPHIGGGGGVPRLHVAVGGHLGVRAVRLPPGPPDALRLRTRFVSSLKDHATVPSSSLSPGDWRPLRGLRGMGDAPLLRIRPDRAPGREGRDGMVLTCRTLAVSHGAGRDGTRLSPGCCATTMDG